MIAVPGSWKSLEDLEDNVTLDELISMLSKFREMRFEEHKFQASLHQMTMGGDEPDDDFTRVQKRVEERLRREQEENSQGGYTEENDAGLMALGISVTKE